MRLLFDQNLSLKLVEKLTDLYPNSSHVQIHKLGQANDSAVWNFAKENEYVIVTKDADFHERRILLGKPPNVVWIRKGNCSTEQIELLLRQNFELIEDLSRNDTGFIILR